MARRVAERRAALVFVAALGVVLSASGAEAARGRGARGGATAWDREAQRRHDEVVRIGGEPRAIVPLMELGSTWELAPARTLALLHSLGTERRLLPLLRVYARSYEAALLRRAGMRDDAAAVSRELGFVRAWRVLGPFGNEGRRGFTTPVGPELALDRPTDPSGEHAGFGRAVRWETLPDLGPGESVPLAPFFTPFADACAYAETFVEVDRARPLALFVGASGAVKVWWNGALALEDGVYRSVDADRVAALVPARQGWNRVLVKVCSTDTGLGFMLRAGEPDGTPIVLRADPSRTAPSPAPAAPVAMPAEGPRTVLAELEAAVAARPDDAVATEALARYLVYSGGADPTTNRARDLAVRATELGATADNLTFAAARQSSRAERMRLVERAVALAPRDAETRLEHISVIADGAAGERALRMLEALRADGHIALEVDELRARMLGQLGFHRSAHAIYESLARRVPGSPYYMRLLADSEVGRGHTSRVTELRRQILAIDAGDAAARRALVDAAIARNDAETARAMVGDEIAMHPISGATLAWAAGVYDALAAEDEAVAMRQRIVDLDSGDADARVALGRMLLRLGRREPAIVTLREAQALRPQDAETRRLLEQVAPAAPRPDEAYATPIEDILARRRDGGGYPATILHDLEVHSVHESGIASRFRQIVTQIHDAEGARAQRYFGFEYEPGSEWVEVRAVRVHRDGQVLTSYSLGEQSLAQPAFRIYYSARRVVVTYPELRPGDVIELRYRVDDVAARNAYADYFGAIRPLQSGVPVALREHVFLTPSARRFFFHAPAGIVRHVRREENGTRIDRFTAADVPALRGEPDMPGYVEVAPYLHVSTFETFEQVARFWWGLVEEQLEPDAELERTVRELVAGAPDTRTKVQRIYAWATDRVRYVGLEFGIHGHKPYRVTDVVERGFGDCKDTAALLYAMLRIAEVDARIALVRTRPNGEVERNPASLAIFDHAIAYVPELDLYLDGTAEHGGSTELPSMDRGALALLGGPSTAELRTVPVGDPAASGRRRELTIALAPDGSAAIDGREELVGHLAMGARGTYDAPGTRRERLQNALAGLFPGLEIEAESFESMDDRERPVRYTYRGRVPRIGEREGAVVRIAPSTLADLTRTWAPLGSRRHPLVLGPPYHYRERRTLPLAGLRAVDVPQGGVVESPFGRLAIRYTRGPDSVVVETDLRLLRERIAPREYAEFRRWVEAADALLHARVAIGGLR